MHAWKYWTALIPQTMHWAIQIMEWNASAPPLLQPPPGLPHAAPKVKSRTVLRSAVTAAVAKYKLTPTEEMRVCRSLALRAESEARGLWEERDGALAAQLAARTPPLPPLYLAPERTCTDLRTALAIAADYTPPSTPTVLEVRLEEDGEAALREVLHPIGSVADSSLLAHVFCPPRSL